MKDKLMLVPKEEDMDFFVDDSTEEPSSSVTALSKQNEKPTLLARLERALIRSEYVVHEFVDSLRETFPGWRIKRVFVHYDWTDSTDGSEYKWLIQKRVGLVFWKTLDSAYEYGDARDKLNAHYVIHLAPKVTYYK